MKRIILLLIGVLCAFQVRAQDNISYAREIIKTLASDEFKGRGYVDNGNQLAANYIQSELQKMGVNPFNQSYFQSFTTPVTIFPDSMFVRLNEQRLIPGKDFLVDPSSPSIQGNFDVITLKKEDLLSPKKLKKTMVKARGKMILIDETTYISSDKEQDEEIEQVIRFLKYSQQLPIAGVIMYTHKKLTWSGAVTQNTKPVITILNQPNLKQITTLSINVRAAFIQAKTQNVLGYIRGTEQPDSFLVVTAHYDHLGMMGAETCFYGANDNASGVAMLLCLARYFSEHPPKYTMVFLALSAEEIGLVGAKYFVEHPVFKLSHIKFLTNFDLAGTGDEGIKVVNATIYPHYFKQLETINTNRELLPAIKKRGEACNSDHCMFYQKGVPCFYLYTLGGISAYHDIYDKYETLPLTEFEDYTSLMISFLESF